MTRAPKECRGGLTCRPASMPEAQHCAIHHGKVEPKQLSMELPARYGYVLDAGNTNRPDAPFQARLLEPLMRVSGNLAPLHYLADAFDLALVALPTRTEDSAPVLDAFLSLASALGESGDQIRAAMADGKLTADEVFEIAKSLKTLAQHAMHVEGAMFAKLLIHPESAKMALQRVNQPLRRRA